jgi:RNA polymerase-binding transcription factor DksA
MNDGNNGTDDTSPTFKAFEEEAKACLRKELAAEPSVRKKFTDLKNALFRVENKTYGVCYR